MHGHHQKEGQRNHASHSRHQHCTEMRGTQHGVEEQDSSLHSKGKNYAETQKLDQDEEGRKRASHFRSHNGRRLQSTPREDKEEGHGRVKERRPFQSKRGDLRILSPRKQRSSPLEKQQTCPVYDQKVWSPAPCAQRSQLEGFQHHLTPLSSESIYPSPHTRRFRHDQPNDSFASLYSEDSQNGCNDSDDENHFQDAGYVENGVGGDIVLNLDRIRAGTFRAIFPRAIAEEDKRKKLLIMIFIRACVSLTFVSALKY